MPEDTKRENSTDRAPVVIVEMPEDPQTEFIGALPKVGDVVEMVCTYRFDDRYGRRVHCKYRVKA